MKKLFFLSLVAISAMIVSCNKQGADLTSNPLVNPAETYFSAPDFSSIKIEHFRPAFEEGIRVHKLEIDSIANNSEAPTFENTLVALEKSGQLLARVSSVFSALASANTNDSIIAIETDLAPVLAAHRNDINLNDKLFKRIKAVYETGQSALDAEDQRLVKVYYDNFVKAGALLSSEEKKLLAKLNQEEASLTTDFGNRLTKASNAPLYFSKEELEGLSESELQAAANAAKENGQEGKYMIRLGSTTQQAVMTNLKNRKIRKAILEASMERCQKGDANDTRDIVKRLAIVRSEKAKLLGYPNYAAWNLTDCLAKEPANVIGMLSRLADLAKGKIETDTKELQDFARKTEGTDFNLEAWDWSYYAELLRKEKYGVDEAMLSEYFVLDSVLVNGAFYAANKMYGLTFKPRTDVPVYHKDVTVWDVVDKNGEALGLFYFDPFARPSKSGGAWMGNFVDQSSLLGHKPVIYNVCNYANPTDGKPALISWDNVTTLFHEFGHALHGFFANQKYQLISGTNVPRDFVEMPSQFNEHAAEDADVFAHYAKHYKTGEVMPKELQEKMKKAQSFNQAYPLAENFTACFIDMAWHMLTPEEAAAVGDVQVFQEDQRKKYSVAYPAIPPRYGTTYFRHIWSNGYPAGYYAYLWTEALCDDIFQTMENNGGLNATNGQRFREMILSRGNTTDLMQLFTDFTGHKEVDLNPLLKARGLK